MQITSNTTGMPADLSVVTDQDARDHCLVVVKGTFDCDLEGRLSLAPEQRPLATIDQHYGAPESSSVRYECDFVLEKPFTDVIVVGRAIAPGGRPVKKLPVRLEVQGRRKDLLVHGDRQWTSVLGSIGPGEPSPFVEMPLRFERAFGGQDDSLGLDRVAIEPRNPVGVGFHPHRKASETRGLPVPNIELPSSSVTSPRGRYEPAGFGCIGRSWLPRLPLAGTYDARWREERAPGLPIDFDPRFFQCAPLDQQFPRFRGGEQIRCVHLAERQSVRYVIPSAPVPVKLRFADRDLERTAVLDTVTLEPNDARAVLVWRASAPLPKKLTALREVVVGSPPRETGKIIGYRGGKPVFAGLEDTLAWLRKLRGDEP